MFQMRNAVPESNDTKSECQLTLARADIKGHIGPFQGEKRFQAEVAQIACVT